MCNNYISGFLAEVLSPCVIFTPGGQGEACMIPPSRKGESASSCACRYMYKVTDSLKRGGVGAHTNVGAVGQMTYANIYTHVHTSQSSLCLNTCIILVWLDIVTMLQTPHCILLYTNFNLIGEVHMHPPCTPHNIPELVCSGHPH